MGYLSRIHRGQELYSRWGIRKEGKWDTYAGYTGGRNSTAGGGLERKGSGIPKQDTQGAGTLQQVGD